MHYCSVQHRVLDASFFERTALVVAKELLGKFLVRRLDGQQIALPITQTEAYIGPQDLACHASRGRTPRTDVMFGPGGHWYVYFIYGIHWMLNVVTGKAGHPSAVLFRGAGPYDGPAKLTAALSIDRSLNGAAADPNSGLWIEDRGLRVSRLQIQRTPRIGVDYSGPWAEKLYRFVLVRDIDAQPMPES
jgi:DNA-3-methyladenine glycosylase